MWRAHMRWIWCCVRWDRLVCVWGGSYMSSCTSVSRVGHRVQCGESIRTHHTPHTVYSCTTRTVHTPHTHTPYTPFTHHKHCSHTVPTPHTLSPHTTHCHTHHTLSTHHTHCPHTPHTVPTHYTHCPHTPHSLSQNLITQIDPQTICRHFHTEVTNFLSKPSETSQNHPCPSTSIIPMPDPDLGKFLNVLEPEIVPNDNERPPVNCSDVC